MEIRTFRDLHVPKSYLSKKSVSLYKAYILEDGEKMKVREDLEILALTPEAALQYAINNSLPIKDTNIGEAVEPTIFDSDEAWWNRKIQLLKLTFDRDELLDTPLIGDTVNGQPFYEEKCLAITLTDRKYQMAVEERQIKSIKLTFNPKTEEKTIAELVWE